MNGRTVTALVLAPIACGLVFGAWILWGLERSESPNHSLAFVAFLPGMMYGALFEVLALLPLLFLFRRRRRGFNSPLVACGVALWAVAILLNTWVTSELPLRQLSMRDVAMILLPLMLPGLALVLVFVFVAQSGEAKLPR